MWAYIARRLIIGIGLLVAMSFVTYMLFFATGNPARSMCERNCTEQRISEIAEVHGFDKPVLVQYGRFMKGIFAGRDYPVNDEYRERLIAAGNEHQITRCEAPCLGFSTTQQETVNALMAEALPVTISMGVVAFIMWMIIAILSGVTAAVNQGKWVDKAIVGTTLALYAMPTFFIGNFLLKYFAIKWQIFPFPQYVSIADGGFMGWLNSQWLPAITLAVFFMAAYTRMTRAFVLESMSEDYIRTARAKGLTNRRVLFKHGLRSALTPLTTLAGADIALLLAGALITETVFSYHGIGMLAVKSNFDRDLPVLVGIVMFSGAAIIVMNIIVDVAYAYLDPRVKAAR